jgi:acetyl-CoA carboxylase biotin carboxylase subunit
LKRVLIANRGEIALRIIRACHEDGLEAVAVYSTADRLSPHVRAADHAVHIGPAPASDSYLRIDRLLEAAAQSGADGVHPGYGFLAERAAFADAVVGAGLAWVGPPASAIRAMGDKTEARRRMRDAGVPVVPGAVEPVREADAALTLAAEIGYPVMVKAAAGGGGKGMRVVHAPDELPSALAAAGSEALKAFGDAGVYLERFIERPRHVEIQVLADHERTIHLGERECSVQRRHQKLVEEAPSVAVGAELRERMGAAAVAAARAVDYRGAGTCEFLLAADGSFYFLEMNTRIQVEHPVSELVTGIDIVQEQIRIAGGASLPFGQSDIVFRGHAIECRVNAESPQLNFRPSPGLLLEWAPPQGPNIRVDSHCFPGYAVPPFYDSLLAKLIVYGRDRADAVRRMQSSIARFRVRGVDTTLPFLEHVLEEGHFARGEVNTALVETLISQMTTETVHHG